MVSCMTAGGHDIRCERVPLTLLTCLDVFPLFMHGNPHGPSIILKKEKIQNLIFGFFKIFTQNPRGPSIIWFVIFSRLF